MYDFVNKPANSWQYLKSIEIWRFKQFLYFCIFTPCFCGTWLRKLWFVMYIFAGKSVMLVSMKSDKSSILKNIVSLFSLRFYFIFSETFLLCGHGLKQRPISRYFFVQKQSKFRVFIHQEEKCRLFVNDLQHHWVKKALFAFLRVTLKKPPLYCGAYTRKIKIFLLIF